MASDVWATALGIAFLRVRAANHEEETAATQSADSPSSVSEVADCTAALKTARVPQEHFHRESSMLQKNIGKLPRYVPTQVPAVMDIAPQVFGSSCNSRQGK